MRHLTGPTLHEWQRLAGHLNWLLNVLPWGWPALTELYRKISGKDQSQRRVPINAEVITDLEWLKVVIPCPIGIRFDNVGLWTDHEADMIMWTDASLHIALSFVFANKGFMYSLRAPPPGKKIDIFFLELLAIMSAIHYAGLLPQPPRRLLIWTDSLDAVGIILHTGMDLRVRHIEGKKNIRADMLSHLLLDDYQNRYPADCIHFFSPPRELLVALIGCLLGSKADSPF
ncbi:hypothetical protein L208DRAFT_1289779 [Tricholoma matsutake]|nr:hypothetical protein L208DRAFT_1289779 [Tricholoma matsutake 945]